MPDYLRREADKLEAAGGHYVANSPYGNEPVFFLNEPKLGYQFTNRWFEQNNQAVFEAVLAPFLSEVVAKPIRYLEIGVNEGASLVWAMHRLNLSKAVGIDSYQVTSGRRVNERNEALQKAKYRMLKNVGLAMNRTNRQSGFFEFVNQDSRRALFVLINEAAGRIEAIENVGFDPAANDPGGPYFDLIYVDGDHSGSGTMRDLVLSFEILAVGGVIVVDDLNRRWAKGKPQTREAFEGWFSAYENHLEPIYRDKRIAMVQKVKA